MVVTGYQLKRALRDADRRRALVSSQWDDSLWAFPGEEKPEPTELLAAIEAAEEAIARLQAAQARYNLAVQVTVKLETGPETMSMLEAVKRIGGVNRLESMTQKAAKSQDGGYYYGVQRSRSLEEEHAERRLELDAAAALYKRYAHQADAYREAIAVGNATELELEGLDPELLE